MIDQILSRALKQAQAAEVILGDGESQSAEFENNELKYVNTRQYRGAGLRVIREGRLGFSSTTDMDAIDRMVDAALESATFGEQARFELPGPSDYPDVKTFDPAVPALPIDDAVQMGKDAIARVLAAYPDVKCAASIEKSTGTVRLASSAGLDVLAEATEFGVQLEAFRLMGESFLWSGDGSSSRRLSRDTLPHVERTIEFIRNSEKEVAIPTGAYTVVFSPRAMGALYRVFLQGVNGKMVHKGVSPLAGRIGQQVLGAAFTMVDDSTVDYADGSEPCDGEGLPSRPTPLFDKGVLKNYLLDLQTAGLLGMAPTGNASRSYSSQPSPGSSNTVIQGGHTPYADMLNSGGKVILIEHMLGAGQSNTLAGEFSGNIALGFLVEGGEIVGRVKNCIVAGNAYELFNKIGAISRETEWRGSLCTPAFLFEGLTLASREE